MNAFVIGALFGFFVSTSVILGSINLATLVKSFLTKLKSDVTTIKTDAQADAAKFEAAVKAAIASVATKAEKAL